MVLLKCFRKKKKEKWRRNRRKTKKAKQRYENGGFQNKLKPSFQTLKERINLHIWKRCMWKCQVLNPTGQGSSNSLHGRNSSLWFPEIWRMVSALHALRSISGDKKSASGSTGLFRIGPTFISYLTYPWVNWFVSDLSSQFTLSFWHHSEHKSWAGAAQGTGWSPQQNRGNVWVENLIQSWWRN